MEIQSLPAAVTVKAPRASAANLLRADLYLLLFIVVHAPLAIGFRLFSPAPGYHALATLALGVGWATLGRRPELALRAGLYLAGSEVLWRMTAADLFWEFGKYGTALILLLVFARLPSRRTTDRAAFAYLGLLLPSAALTLQGLGASNARDALSFNLSGPFALTVSVLLFSSIRADAVDLRAALCSLLAPAVGVLAICSYSTLTASSIVFYAESNFVTSGGFGPNQVSAILGLGAVLSLLLAVESSRSLLRWAFFGLTLGFLVQAILTFSRGGVINAAICMGFLMVHLIQQPRVRVTVLVLLVLLTFLGYTFILPRLNHWTGGALEERYATTTAGLRQTLVEEELELWREHPLLGVGPGMGKYYRSSLLGMEVAAHTEFTRLLAEHGSLGAVALLLLVAIAARAYLRAPSSLEKAWVSTFAGWAFLAMSHSSMRTAVISLLFGLACLRWPPRHPE